MPRPKTPRIVFLRGGKSRKGGTTVRVESERYLGGGAEGRIFESEISVLNGKERERKARIARKEFDIKRLIDWGGNFRKPEKQFKLVRELMDLNKKKKLGLRVPKTLRLVKEGKKTSLAMSFYPAQNKKGLRKKLGFWQWKERGQFTKDKVRQINILEREGITALYDWGDVFKPLIQTNGACVAILLDFGNLIKAKEKEQGTI